MARALRRGRRLLPVVFALALGLAELIARTGFGERLDAIYADQWHRWAGVRHVPEHVALVVVDDASLMLYQDDPFVFWTPHLAKASATLRAVGAKAIAIDFMLSVSPESWLRKMNLPESEMSRTYDVPFRTEIASGSVLLSGARLAATNKRHDQFLLPHRDYLLAVPDFDLGRHVGFTDLESDADGAVRRFVVAPELRLRPEMRGESLPNLTLAALLAVRASGEDLNAAAWMLGGRSVQRNGRAQAIAYSGPPGTFPRISLSRLVEPSARDDPEVRSLAGKAVIVGGEFFGMQDWHITPYSIGLFGRTGKLMTGLEVHANIAETLLSGRSLEPMPAPIRVVLYGLVLAAAAACYIRFDPLRGAFVLLAGLLLSAELSFVAFTRYLDLPVAGLHAVLALAYFAVLWLRLAGESRERERITAMFGRYVSNEIVDVLVNSDQPPDLGGQAAEVTILFSDIRSFTTLSERMSPHEVVEFLNEYLQRVCEPILAEGGTVDKFIGDAVMAQFGAPVAHPDHALRALRADLGMRAVAESFGGWMAQRFGRGDQGSFGIGIGLHTGVAVIGNIGSKKRMEYTAIGDTVNVASRLESLTKSLGVTIAASKATLDAAGVEVLTGRHSVEHVKGRSEAIEVFEVIGLKDGAS